MICTQKLYDTLPYATEFRATVLSCEPTDSGFAVVLDQTLFFPEEGGQCCDVGTLGGAAVRHVSIDGGVITHICAYPLADEVTGTIDFSRRFRNMQNHSAEHIVSGIVNRRFSYQNVGFHLGADVVTMDYDGFLNEEQLSTIEAEANRIVWKNLPILADYPSREVLETLEYRSKKPIDGAVRIVTIPDCDVCACCAPHVAHTGEIGMIKLLYAERYKGGCRVYLLAGSDAVRDYSEKSAVLYRLGAALSVPPIKVPEALERLLAENDALRVENSKRTHALCAAIVSALPTDRSLWCRIFSSDEFPPHALKALAETAQARCRVAALFCEVGDEVPTSSGNSSTRRYQFLLYSSDSHLNEVFSEFKSAFAVKGGGRSPCYQGTVIAERGQIEEFFEARF